MGHGPAPRGDAPLSPYVHALIQRKAKQLCRRSGYSRADPRDFAQELVGRLLKKLDQYDSARGASRDTFADRVIDTEVKMIIRDSKRLKRAPELAATSLEGGSTLVGGKPVPLLDVIADSDRQRAAGSSCISPLEAANLAADVQQALAPLSPDVIAVAEALKAGSVLAVSRDLRISRRQVHAAMAIIKARLMSQGFGN